MRLVSSFLGLFLVATSAAQWSYGASNSPPVQCSDGATIPLGECSPQFQRCRCNEWITAVCPASSIFDVKAQLCLFSSDSCTTTTAIPVTSTSVPVTTTYVPVTTAPSTTPQYPTEGYTTTVAPQTPTDLYPTAGYTTTLAPAPEYPTAGYTTPSGPQYPTQAYPTAGYTTSAAPQSPTEGYPAQDAPSYPTSYDSSPSYPAQDSSSNAYIAPGIGVQYPSNVLSNPFFVPRRYNRHSRRHHHYGWDEDVRMGKLPARSQSVVVEHRRYPVDDVFRAPDSKRIYTNTWNVFPRSKVHRKSKKDHRQDDHEEIDDGEPEMIPRTTLTPDVVPVDTLAVTEAVEETTTLLTEPSESEPSIVPEVDGSGDAPVDDNSGARWKRSYQTAEDDLPKSRCSGAADNSIFSLGVCSQNFVICRSSQGIMAACPAGDLFDFDRGSCVPSAVCGSPTADVCAADIPTTAPETTTTTWSTYPVPTFTTPAYPPESTTSYPTESTTRWTPAYPVESTTQGQPTYTMPSNPGYLVESTPSYPQEVTTVPSESTTSAAETTTQPVYPYPSDTPTSGSPYYPFETTSQPYEVPATTSADTTTSPRAPVTEVTTTVGPSVPTEVYPMPTELPTSPYAPQDQVETMTVPSSLYPTTPKIVYISVSSDPSKFCIGRGDSLYRDPSDCSGIVQCHGGEMFQHIGCPSGLVFNEYKQQCDYKYQVPACDVPEQSPAANVGCRGAQHGAYLPDEADCTIFFRCVWDRLERMSCPTGTVFNPTLSVCDWPASVPQCSAAADNTLPTSPY